MIRNRNGMARDCMNLKIAKSALPSHALALPHAPYFAFVFFLYIQCATKPWFNLMKTIVLSAWMLSNIISRRIRKNVRLRTHRRNKGSPKFIVTLYLAEKEELLLFRLEMTQFVIVRHFFQHAAEHVCIPNRLHSPNWWFTSSEHRPQFPPQGNPDEPKPPPNLELFTSFSLKPSNYLLHILIDSRSWSTSRAIQIILFWMYATCPNTSD